MCESLRGEGGRVWVPRTDRATTRDPGKPIPPKGERWYFLEENYPKYGNLVPRDIATREIFHVCRDMGLGVGGRDAVYLDVTHIPRRRRSTRKLGRRAGDLREVRSATIRGTCPMEIFPGMHYSMGGLWVDYEADAEARTSCPSPAQPHDQHPRPLRRRRVRLPVPRRQPAGRQLAALLHLRGA